MRSRRQDKPGSGGLGLGWAPPPRPQTLLFGQLPPLFGVFFADQRIFLALLTAEQVLDVLRESAHEAETVYYLYVLDEESHLTGVLSLRDLVLAQPSVPISEIMETRIVTVDLNDSQEECAQLISKYNLLAVPVVDREKRLHGIVTADDALDKIIPTAWKKRLPRMYR